MLSVHPIIPSMHLIGVEKQLPCGDICHYQPLFFPTTCHHPHKVIVADLDEGMGTLVHKGSKRNPAFGLWPLRQALVQTIRRTIENKDNGEETVQQEVDEMESGEEAVSDQAMSLSDFLGEKSDDADWELVEQPAVIKEKFVLVGKREVGDVRVGSGVQPEWVEV